MLLHWSVLEPAEPVSFAAVRFASPVRVHSIRVFPTLAKPFQLSPDIVARTEPDSFFADVYFNVHSVFSTDAKNKQKAANALLQTSIAYTGVPMEFVVDMASDFSTRLMIIKGDFTSISLAIYGELVAEGPKAASIYEPAPLPMIEPSPLSRELDPAHSKDPTLLARQLLLLIPQSPPLPLVIRLMLCLKPTNDDWDRPEFPYIYADLDPEGDGFSLENAYKCTMMPVDDDSSVDYLENFARRVAECVVPKVPTQVPLVAGILRHSAPQHPGMSALLIKHFGSLFFDTLDLDEQTITRLLTAASNVDIAKGMRTDRFSDRLKSMQSDLSLDKRIRADARKLLAKIEGWHVLEDALSNTQADFSRAATIMDELGSEEFAFGILVQCLISHPQLLMALSENPVLPMSQVLKPLPPHHSSDSVSHDDFIAFVRAYIGISCVLATYAWADSLPHEGCRERALGILRIWQTIDGYREIVNRLLLLRQMSLRLECLATHPWPPTQSGLHVEHILLHLAAEPRSFLREEFVTCILSLQQPLLFITEEDRISMRHMAVIADRGLTGVIEELALQIEPPLEMRKIKALRVSLAILENELKDADEGLWRILHATWVDNAPALILRLVDLLTAVKNDLGPHFGVAPPPWTTHEIVRCLFDLANEILRLVTPIVSACLLTSRSIRALAITILDIFVYTDAADMCYSQANAVCIAANVARSACISLVRKISSFDSDSESAFVAPTVLLETLLEHGARQSSGDPVLQLLQAFCLVDEVVPQPATEEERTFWVTSVLSNVVPALTAFFRNLDTGNKVHLLRRLIALDQGVIGIGEWLLQDEISEFSCVIHFLDDTTIEEHHRFLAQHQILLSLRFISHLISNPSVSTWFHSVIQTPEISHALANCFISLLDHRLFSADVGQIARCLADGYKIVQLEAELSAAIILMLYCGASLDANMHQSFGLALSMLKEISLDTVDWGRLRREVGAALFAASETPLTEEIAKAILDTLQWWSEQEDPRVAVSVTAMEQLCSNLSEVVDSNDAKRLKVAQSRIIPTSIIKPVAPTGLPSSMSLSLDEICNLLRPPIAIPLTPEHRARDEVFNMVAISPPTAFLRSPAVTGLTKTYLNNDFRELRSIPSARQNTSRLPSTHVDDFQANTSSPIMVSQRSPEIFHALSLSPTFNTM